MLTLQFSLLFPLMRDTHAHPCIILRVIKVISSDINSNDSHPPTLSRGVRKSLLSIT